MVRDLMVHLDGSGDDDIRLEFGRAIAAEHRAQLIGLFTNLLPDFSIAMPIEAGAPALLDIVSELEDRARKDGDQTAARLRERLSALQVPVELRRLDDTFASLNARTAEEARCADLFLATRPHGESDGPVWVDLVETVLFGSGRALLLLPPGYARKTPLRTILVAWNGSREAARALREAMSFIEKASRTVLLVVDAKPGERLASQVRSHLARYGVAAELVFAKSDGRAVSDVILDQAQRLSADLVVMGGYGHMRVREQVFGGTTLEMLSRSGTPILLAH
jgi:nucleotide-binding universal stress UspA family protein